MKREVHVRLNSRREFSQKKAKVTMVVSEKVSVRQKQNHPNGTLCGQRFRSLPRQSNPKGSRELRQTIRTAETADLGEDKTESAAELEIYTLSSS